jgi:uncharacterized Zn finger protein
MRCVACNKCLSDFESTRKVVREDGSKDFVDLCNTCYHASDLSSVATVVERFDLSREDDVEIDEDDDSSTLLDEYRGCCGE